MAKEAKKNDVAKEAKKYAAPREAGIVCAYEQGEKYGFIKHFDFRAGCIWTSMRCCHSPNP